MTSNCLSQIETGVKKRPRRVLLYGAHGVGKSTWASQAPNPIFIQTEDGANDIGVARFPVTTHFASVIDMLRELYKEKHSYKTLVIDSVDWLERMIWEMVCKKENVESIDDIEFWKGYSTALIFWNEFIEALDFLRNDKNMNIVLISHCKIFTYNNPEDDDYDRYSPKLHKHASSLLQEWADDVFFANFDVDVVTKGKGFKEKKKAMGNGERIIYTSEKPAYFAKNRLGITENLKMNWSDYQAKINNAGKTSKEEKQ